MTKEISSIDVLKERALKEEERFTELVRESNIIFVGVVEEVRSAPRFWSGRIPSYQTVKYKVEDVLKGDSISEICVAHVVVSGSKTARKDEPGLSTSLFRKDNRLIVIAAKTDQGEWKSLHENLGTALYSEETLNRIKGFLR
ncbi:hypothetical protein L0152_30790 [bacterium]|nr:hypothetical protein [bacterium]